TLARCLLGLHPIDAGTVVFSGRDITHLSERVRRPLRRHMQFIFQAPRAAVDPRQRVDQIVGEPLATFGLVPRAARPERVERLLDRVGLEAGLGSSYPHELSGGQLQRVCIARALASGPRLLVADEPTSALDLVAQARVLHLLSKLRDEGLALLFITHNLRLVPTFCDDVAVMDDGVIVERLAAQDLAASTSPPTRALLDALG
ncbi:MAG: ABC transporter ATP-binding protein, partial [Deltaproteobacteria bacterium]|nr:ABC transporter ATP-binding protein [Deltaproteobacteria bacterium]